MKCSSYIRNNPGLWAVTVKKRGLVSSVCLLGSKSVPTNLGMPKTLCLFLEWRLSGRCCQQGRSVCFGPLIWILKNNHLFEKSSELQ
jgi:hypothetical protein